jgi:dTDP-4-dehydrorhamnose 3,5-epimerase
MKTIQTGFDGLILFEPNVFSDDRGLFYESWRANDYKEYGIQDTFVQDNISISKKNVLRGLHFQKNQGQLVWVVFGKVFDVVVDIRPDSPTFKKYFSIELSGDNPKQLYMAPGFAHGFYVLSDTVIMNYKCTQYYNPQEEVGILWNDPALGIQWPGGTPFISPKDQQLSNLDNVLCKIS